MKQRGYVALISVLIVGSAALAIAVGLLIGGTDSQRATAVTQHATQARALASACGEEALQKIHDNTSFTGTNGLALGQGTCSYTVTDTGGNTRTVDATGTVSTNVRKIKVYVTIGASSISITSWQEVV